MSSIILCPEASEEQISKIENYLTTSRNMFWESTKSLMSYQPTISGYTTVLDCIRQEYPYLSTIHSLLQFCNEVCIVDGGSTDGTIEEIIDLITIACPGELSKERADILKKDPLNVEISTSRVKFKVINRDKSYKNYAIFDGMNKAEARKLCTSEYCWQSDCDEVVHESDNQKIVNLCKHFPRNSDILALPVVEYWGSLQKTRVDVNPWKWRLSRNKSYITHGVPKQFRSYDSDGNLFLLCGDGCDYVDATTFEIIPHMSFYTEEVHNMRMVALQGDTNALKNYEAWFNAVVDQLPTVFHYSWLDIKRKIRLYKNYWSKHWQQLNGIYYADNADNNMFFDLPWSDVTEEMIADKAKELEKTGGHIFHAKYTGNITPSIKINRTPPRISQ